MGMRFWMENEEGVECENPEPSVETWDEDRTKRKFTLSLVHDCGDPDCSGQCDHCKEYEAYCKRMEKAKMNCKVKQGLANCTCELCVAELYHPQNDVEQE